MKSWWWNGQLSLREMRDKLELKEAFRATEPREALLERAEQLVDYAIEQRAQFKCALARIMELEAKEALQDDHYEQMAAELQQELGVREYDDQSI